jgi:hypothetical protein
MTETSRSAGPTVQGYAGPAPTAWVGWVLFAGIMMMLTGGFAVIEGIVALVDKSYFHVGPHGLLVHMSYTGWGWTHIGLGTLAVAAGASLMTGRTWARVVAVTLAFVSAFVNLAFLAAFPIWSTIMITIDVLVIWAVTVHGREVRQDY